MRPPARASVAFSSAIVHAPASAHWFVVSSRRNRIVVLAIAHGTAGRCEILGAVVADVGFRRLHARLRRHRDAADVRLHDAAGDFRAGFGQQLLDDRLGFGVVAFAEMVMADAAFGVDEVVRGPVLIVERAPDRVVVVDRDRIVDASDP